MDDQTFAALAHAHRREVLLALAARDADAPALDAAAAVSDTNAEPDTLRISLHHTHLPTLESAGLIEWDRDGFEVSRGPDFDAVAPVLAVLEAEREPRRLPA